MNLREMTAKRLQEILPLECLLDLPRPIPYVYLSIDSRLAGLYTSLDHLERGIRGKIEQNPLLLSQLLREECEVPTGDAERDITLIVERRPRFYHLPVMGGLTSTLYFLITIPLVTDSLEVVKTYQHCQRPRSLACPYEVFERESEGCYRYMGKVSVPL